MGNKHWLLTCSIATVLCVLLERSFPAGHASGGFALTALYYLPVKQHLHYAGLVSGIALGWCMGLYQMARGEHFLSHTLTTMFLALVVILSVNYACEYLKASLHSGQPAQLENPDR